MEDLSQQAFKWVKENKKLILNKFCSREIFLSYKEPIIMFMAGSPGAGKTEYSKELIRDLEKKDLFSKIIRVDADDIRKLIPQFDGKNSSLVQKAASKGVDIICDYAFKYKQNILVDGTFANYSISRQNIKRALKRTKKINIFYLYQEPLIAWEFTKAREKIEKRKISKKVFIDTFIKSRENVCLIKKEFINRVEVNIIIQNRNNNKKKIYSNVKNVDNYLIKRYNADQLSKIIK